MAQNEENGEIVPRGTLWTIAWSRLVGAEFLPRSGLDGLAAGNCSTWNIVEIVGMEQAEWS